MPDALPGPDHYAEDGRWWWDDDRRRWFRTTSQEDGLEVEAEDMGGTSCSARAGPTDRSTNPPARFSCC
jgi:hypothetical protein